MVKQICRDEMFLARPSVAATKDDMQVVTDLMDTLRANMDGCVGMAANMIGVSKRIIVVSLGFAIVPMINPIIKKKGEKFETEEGCLSLVGQRKTTRYRKIEVEYYDASWKKQRQEFQGFIAQIIQHECDHLDGIII